MIFDQRDGLLFQTAIRFSTLFKANQIRYYIVGGYAMIFHRVVRNTMDIDIIVAEDDFQRASQVCPTLDSCSTLFMSLANVVDFRRNRICQSPWRRIVRAIQS